MFRRCAYLCVVAVISFAATVQAADDKEFRIEIRERFVGAETVYDSPHVEPRFPGQITRADYVEALKQNIAGVEARRGERTAEELVKEGLSSSRFNVMRFACWYCFTLGTVSHITGEPEYMQLAHEYVMAVVEVSSESTERRFQMGGMGISYVLLTVDLLDNKNVFTKSELDRIEIVILDAIEKQPDWTAGRPVVGPSSINYAIGMVNTLYAALYYADNPRVSNWVSQLNQSLETPLETLPDMPHRVRIEGFLGIPRDDAPLYCNSWAKSFVLWQDLIMKEPRWNTPEAKSTWEFFANIVASDGYVPAFGDDAGWNNAYPCQMATLERGATVYKRGDYKWLAHRLFEFVRDHYKNGANEISMFNMHYLALAVLWADDRIRPVKPDNKPIVLTSQPNKLAMRSGWDSGDFYLLQDFFELGHHSNMDINTITALTWKGALLLDDGGYGRTFHWPTVHNGIYVKRGSFEPAASMIDVPQLKQEFGRQLELAQAHIADACYQEFVPSDWTEFNINDYVDYAHAGGLWYSSARTSLKYVPRGSINKSKLDPRVYWRWTGMWRKDAVPAGREQRTVCALKNGLILIVDDIDLTLEGDWTTAALFATRAITDSGRGYYDTYLPFWGDARNDSGPIHNPEQIRLLVHFPEPLNTGTAQVPRIMTRHDKGDFKESTLVGGRAVKGPCEVRLISVLMAHDASTSAADIVRAISVEQQGDAVLVLYLPSDGNEQYLLCNPSHTEVSIGKLETNAKALWLRRDQGGKPSYSIIEGSALTFEGEELLNTDEKRNLEGKRTPSA